MYQENFKFEISEEIRGKSLFFSVNFLDGSGLIDVYDVIIPPECKNGIHDLECLPRQIILESQPCFEKLREIEKDEIVVVCERGISGGNCEDGGYIKFAFSNFQAEVMGDEHKRNFICNAGLPCCSHCRLFVARYKRKIEVGYEKCRISEIHKKWGKNVCV